jgi:hypothetical protein
MKSVGLPDGMYDEILTNIVNACPELGYESVDEYVIETIRRRWYSAEGDTL